MACGPKQWAWNVNIYVIYVNTQQRASPMGVNQPNRVTSRGPEPASALGHPSVGTIIS